jgi:hypothetical protein
VIPKGRDRTWRGFNFQQTTIASSTATITGKTFQRLQMQ